MDASTGQRFRLWVCACGVVLSVGAFLLAVAAGLTSPAVFRTAVQATALAAILAWAAGAAIGSHDRGLIAAATRPRRLARRYVIMTIVTAVLTAVAEAAVSVTPWRVPIGAVAACLAIAAAAGFGAWQTGINTRVDLDAAAHIRGARVMPRPRPPSDPVATDDQVVAATAAEGLARARARHRR